jgi:hypothetical protein
LPSRVLRVRQPDQAVIVMQAFEVLQQLLDVSAIEPQRPPDVGRHKVVDEPGDESVANAELDQMLLELAGVPGVLGRLRALGVRGFEGGRYAHDGSS